MLTCARPASAPMASDAPKICEVVAVDLVRQAGVAALIERGRRVETDAAAVREDQPMERDGETLLAELGDRRGGAEHAAAGAESGRAGSPGRRPASSPSR